ncbi:odorant receptor 94a-like isoform X2 [Cardiocondyla obscurior]|uniref:odorant receptor 94a-like isoform X2 n=1 Tax=Cardiocondyla obscurior TaxID=286306 RepID=UPI0039657919
MLKYTLTVCSVAGFWQPLTWTSMFKHIIYKTFAAYLISTAYICVFSQFINIIINVDNSDEFTDTLYMMLTILVAGYKQVYIWIYRKNFLDLIKILTEKPFAPCDSSEKIIQEKFEYFIKRNTRRYLTVVMMSVAAMILMSVSTDLKERNLTFKAWIPFDYSSPTVYFFVYTHQLIAMYDSAIVNVSSESLLCGFLQHICCQFEILGYRLTKVKDDESFLRDCISHHNRIFEYAYTVNNLFAKVIAAQFPVSMLVVCSNLYRLAMTTDFVSFVALVSYTSVMLVQIFNYCWFGNKVKLKVYFTGQINRI